ncbi:hypothetical protein CUMW_278890 [Citrus unshiu]|uniref:Bidirectional sugar transporter SWEET n=1 Tax=Citrus unshiu TaxID=55188 RepID=A0A2H5N8D8_CITUN|nr:hypothetical protein CUMW_278890 [Citrus unshiu]
MVNARTIVGIVACLNCMFWILYGLPVVHPGSTLVITINATVVGLGLLAEVIFVGVIAIITFLAFHTHTSRSMFVGILCDIFNIIMYASPLTIWHKVITTKSVEYMPFFLSLANFANGCIWTAYALIKLDIYILVSNGLGAILGFIQLVIYACYYKSTPKKGNDDDFVKPKPTEVQLSGAAMA